MMKDLLTNHFIALMTILWITFLIPVLIASYRKCKHINGIALVNILLGATILGWIGALIWAVSDSKDLIKHTKHRIWIYVSIGVFAIGIISSNYIFQNMYNKPHEDIENATPAYSINAQELWKQYITDLKVADSLYTGKVIEISGTLNRADKSDSLVYAVFVMEVDSMFGDKSVRCEMLQKYNEEASALQKDAQVKIKGFCTGFDQTDIKFNKCSIVK